VPVGGAQWSNGERRCHERQHYPGYRLVAPREIGLSKEHGSEELQVLRGRSSVELKMWGSVIEFCGAILIIPLAFESKVKSIEIYYGPILLGLAIAGVTWGVATTIWSYRKANLEVARGYTPSNRVAATNPGLYWVHPKTFKIVRRPEEGPRS
jgi:hypothetical protein